MFFVVCPHYVSSYYDYYHYHSSSYCCVLTTTVMLAPTSVGHITLGQQNVDLPPQLIPRHTMKGSAGLTNVPQQCQPQSQMASQAYANYAMGALQVSFSFRVEPPVISCRPLGVWCLLWCLPSAFRFPWGHVHLWGGQPLRSRHPQSFSVYPWQAHVHPGDCLWSMPDIQRVVAPPTASGRGHPAAHLAVIQPFQQYCGAYSFGESQSPNPSIFPTWWGGIFFSR